ncbi:hypothetical protein K2173_000162 [Erythroxylum novogranatense]|uniref:Hexosyltransferase n=1 Tax=Erythroxylum novogranatense TaxID=1862640 RepID=A0AAV8SPC4_9ROSI|nr:hypothetical protein K2173_000162 [Erythroxylum novogranatense]
MKGSGGGGPYQGKRRWRCLVIGVLFLVVLSMLVPLGFLLGLYKGFQSSGYLSDQPIKGASSMERSQHVHELINILRPTLPKDFRGNFANDLSSKTNVTTVAGDSERKKGIEVPPHATLRPVASIDKLGADSKKKSSEHTKGPPEGSEKLCELKFGSYCLWREKHREDMKDALVKKLKDQLFVARAYYPSIAKLRQQNKLSHELRQNIQELERVLSESTTDADLPPRIEKKLQKMEAAITRAKSFPVECNNVDKKLRQIFDMTEDEANFHMKQSSFLYQLSVQTMPKSLHCLSMRLTLEYFKSPLHDAELDVPEKFADSNLQHYVLFSSNVLASSVVINSTVTHARDSRNLVFHVLTDGQNYYGMKLWFFKNTYQEAAVQVLNIEGLNLKIHDKGALSSMFLPVEFRVSFYGFDRAHSKTQYISVFSHVHYLLPDIFPGLNRIIVLDDDIVVQKDLSELWNLNMGKKVNGAVQLCPVPLSQLSSYLVKDRFEKDSCAWMSGLNVIDLARWREIKLTETYWKLEQEVGKEAGSTAAALLTASLITFHDLIYTLDSTWTLSGLGHDYGLDEKDINSAAVLHYNGNMKPWFELGIPEYKNYWKRFLNREDQFLGECKVNP